MNVFTGEMSAEQTRMNELYTTLKAWSDAYYNDDAPLATDEEYDRLMRELKQLEAEHPYWVAEDSPTQNVGGKRVIPTLLTNSQTATRRTFLLREGLPFYIYFSLALYAPAARVAGEITTA